MSGVQRHDFGCSLKAYKRHVVDGIRLYGEMHLAFLWMLFLKLNNEIAFISTPLPLIVVMTFMIAMMNRSNS